MGISALCTLFLLTVALFEINVVCALGRLLTGFQQRTDFSGSGITASTNASSVKCNLLGTAGSPVFSKDGDFVLGGMFTIHYKMHTEIYPYTAVPEPPKCTGRLVSQENVFECVFCVL